MQFAPTVDFLRLIGHTLFNIMLKLDKTLLSNSDSWNFDFEFWPRQAEEYLEQGEYSKAIELCEKNIGSEPNLLSAKMIYAQALLGENRSDDATEQLFQVLSLDPGNLAALKLLGDIQYRQNDFVSSMASYGRILEIDPDCRGLKCDFTPKPTRGCLVPCVAVNSSRCPHPL